MLKKKLLVNIFPLALIISFYIIRSLVIFPPIFCFHSRFTATAEMDLKEPLKVLGITEMFDPSKANFAKITSMFSLKCILKLEDVIRNGVSDLFRKERSKLQMC